jgi:1-deoxy-D-xylulose-5-phosphate reductoisomerase
VTLQRGVKEQHAGAQQRSVEQQHGGAQQRSVEQQRSVVLLGSTGSIGSQAIEVIRRSAGRFRVVGLAAGGGRLTELAQQAVELGVEVVGIADPAAAGALSVALTRAVEARGFRAGERREPTVVTGPDAATEVASWPCDLVLNGMVGSLGLEPTLAALKAGRILALANKESLVAGGHLVSDAASPGQIVPVDSEHSAIAQCLRGGRAEEVRRLILTASGGPFRGCSAADLASVTPEDALRHPTWRMGPVITINSATLVNKGLELLEAQLLFDVEHDRIDVVVHPQSIVHSMVEFVDGSTLAQASPPDMSLAISLGLAWPGRVPEAAPGLDWTTAKTWTFEPLDNAVFPAVELAREVGRIGCGAPAVYNAANEVAVAAFLAGRVPFPKIVEVVSDTVSDYGHAGLGNPAAVADVWRVESWARARAAELTGVAPIGTADRSVEA